MILKINAMYKVDGGFIIPRSQIHQEKGDAFCIVEVLQGGENHFTKKHTTFNRKELRKILGLGKGERVEIV